MTKPVTDELKHVTERWLLPQSTSSTSRLLKLFFSSVAWRHVLLDSYALLFTSLVVFCEPSPCFGERLREDAKQKHQFDLCWVSLRIAACSRALWSFRVNVRTLVVGLQPMSDCNRANCEPFRKLNEEVPKTANPWGLPRDNPNPSLGPAAHRRL